MKKKNRSKPRNKIKKNGHLIVVGPQPPQEIIGLKPALFKSTVHYQTPRQAVQALVDKYEGYQAIVIIQYSLGLKNILSLIPALRIILPNSQACIFYYMGDFFGPRVKVMEKKMFEAFRTNSYPGDSLKDFFINEIDMQRLYSPS